VDIEEFTVFFNLGLYTNISGAGSPSDWDPFIIQPDPLLPDDGFVDWLALSFGIPSGDTLDGFSAIFDFIGAGTPGSQYYAVVDPLTFDTLASGDTVPTNIAQVPEPSSFALFAIGLLIVSFFRKMPKLYSRQQNRQHPLRLWIEDKRLQNLLRKLRSASTVDSTVEYNQESRFSCAS